MDKEQIMREALEEVLAQKDYHGFGEPTGRLVYVQAVADKALGRCKEEPHRILQRKTEPSKPERDAVQQEAGVLAYAICNGEHGAVPSKYMKDIASTAEPFLRSVVESARLSYIAQRRPAEIDFMEKCRHLFGLSAACKNGTLDMERAWSEARESYLKLTKSD